MPEIIATEANAASIGGGGGYTSNLCATKTRAVALGCSIRNPGNYSNSQLMPLSQLYKPGCSQCSHCSSDCASHCGGHCGGLCSHCNNCGCDGLCSSACSCNSGDCNNCSSNTTCSPDNSSCGCNTGGCSNCSSNSGCSLNTPCGCYGGEADMCWYYTCNDSNLCFNEVCYLYEVPSGGYCGSVCIQNCGGGHSGCKVNVLCTCNSGVCGSNGCYSNNSCSGKCAAACTCNTGQCRSNCTANTSCRPNS